MPRNAFTRATFPENEKQTLQMILFEKIRYRLVWNHARRLNARDLFLVGCYTGLRFSDIRTLRQTDIGADGWLRKRTQKTGAEVSIPIGDLFDGRMLGLIEKYKGDIGRLCSKAPPNSDVNRTLKPLLAKVKAQERVTFHSSRHTFATLLSERGLSPETIQHLLGHASAQTTQIYNEHAADRRREIMKDLVSLKHRKAR